MSDLFQDPDPENPDLKNPDLKKELNRSEIQKVFPFLSPDVASRISNVLLWGGTGTMEMAINVLVYN